MPLWVEIIVATGAWVGPISGLIIWLHTRRVMAFTAFKAEMVGQLEAAKGAAEAAHRALTTQVTDLAVQVRNHYIMRREVERMITDVKDVVILVRTDLRDARAEIALLRLPSLPHT